jgi:hypothetical protein
MFRKITQNSLIVIILLGSLIACTMQQSAEIENVETPIEVVENTAVPLPTKTPSIPIEGIWFSQDRANQLIITNEAFYFNSLISRIEIYGRVTSFDAVGEAVDILVTAIIHGGNSMGYDSPAHHFEYHLNGTALDVTGLSRFAEIADPELFILDELLNGN